MKHHKLFDVSSEYYAQVRPKYPKEIFEYLVPLCQEQQFAWDSACGNGQAAVSLSHFFKHVEATDISRKQVTNAIRNSKVTYSVQRSEATNFTKNKFDLVCVAQALHWFEYESFWNEVKRVLKPSGIFAAWGYSWFSIEEEIDEIFKEHFLKPLTPYWLPQNKLLWDHYKNVPFPFERLKVPAIKMRMKWDINQLFSYLQSWSAVRLCLADIGENFMKDTYDTVKYKWGDLSGTKTVTMDFCVLVGRNET